LARRRARSASSRDPPAVRIEDVNVRRGRRSRRKDVTNGDFAEGWVITEIKQLL
jgi:hypothetical protein